MKRDDKWTGVFFGNGIGGSAAFSRPVYQVERVPERPEENLRGALVGPEKAEDLPSWLIFLAREDELKNWTDR